MTKNSNHLENNDGPWYYEMHMLGFNYRITDFQCALGSNQLKKLNSFIKIREQIAFKYDKAFGDIDVFKIPKKRDNIQHAYHLYPILIDFERIDLKKIEFFKKMKDVGLNLQVHYVPIHLQPFYKNKYNFKKNDFPVSEKFYKQEVSLPIYPLLKESDSTKVIKNILRFF